MKRILFVAVLCLAVPAWADWSDNFDSYPVGSLNGLGGWLGWDNVPANAGHATDVQSFSAPNSQVIVGSTGTDYTDSVQTFTGYNAGQWVFSGKQYIPATGNAGQQFIILLNNFRHNDPNNRSWSVQWSFHMDTGMMDDQQTLGQPQVPFVRGQWIPWQVNIDLTGNTYALMYNGTQVFQGPWNAPGDANAILEIQALDLFSQTGVNSPVYYDDLALVPEPAALGLLALGLLLRRR